MPEASDIVCIACSVFRVELEALQEQGLLDSAIRFLDSSLHMSPTKLQTRMVPLVEEELGHGHRVLLVYGDCHVYMTDLAQRTGVTRIQGHNCCEILLGRDRYRRLLAEGAFFLFPEWAQRWRRTLSQLLDLNKALTVEMMREGHSKLTYLDTGVRQVPVEELKGCSDYFGLPYEVEDVSLEHLLRVISHAREAARTPWD